MNTQHVNTITKGEDYSTRNCELAQSRLFYLEKQRVTRKLQNETAPEFLTISPSSMFR